MASAAFSLIEILVVVAIIGLVLTLGAPIVSGIGASRGVTQAAYDVTALLEFARAEAIARQTYVWVGITPENAAGTGTVLRLGAAYSKDGSAVITDNYQPLTRAMTVQGVTLTNFSELKSDTQAVLTATGARVSAEAAQNRDVSFKIGGVEFGATGATITFTPRGEAMLEGSPTGTDGFDPLIGIGLRQVRGTTILPDADDVGVVLDGSVGIPLIVRRD